LSVCIIFVLESEVFIRQAKFFKCQGEWDHQLNQSTGFLLIFQIKSTIRHPLGLWSMHFDYSSHQWTDFTTASQVTHKRQWLSVCTVARGVLGIPELSLMVQADV
jgi:hypothetical protein